MLTKEPKSTQADTRLTQSEEKRRRQLVRAGMGWLFGAGAGCTFFLFPRVLGHGLVSRLHIIKWLKLISASLLPLGNLQNRYAMHSSSRALEVDQSWISCKMPESLPTLILIKTLPLFGSLGS